MQLSIYCRNGRTELAVTGPAVTRKGDEYAISYRVQWRSGGTTCSGFAIDCNGAAFQGDVVRLLQSLPEQGDIAITFQAELPPPWTVRFRSLIKDCAGKNSRFVQMAASRC